MDNLRQGFAGAIETAGVHAPHVTIVIVNHNYSKFVKQCIRSVDQQDYPNLQCIVLECASTDDSLSVIEEAIDQAKNPFFQLLRRDVNHGHLINSMTVLDDIEGVFVTYLDADDFLFPEFVSTHIKAHLNDRNSAAVSVTDLIQIDAAGQVLAGTSHWHQKWRAFEEGTAWKDLTDARSWAANTQCRMEQTDITRLFYVPTSWSSWPAERWIWSATSGLMFRKNVVENLVPSKEQSSGPRPNFGVDAYFARLAHSVGGTLLIDTALGAYRRHGKNDFSSNQLLGGQTPSGSCDAIDRFPSIRRLACQTLVTKHRDLRSQFGGHHYYSMVWQLMSNQEFLDFVRDHEEDRAIWENTIQNAKTPKP